MNLSRAHSQWEYASLTIQMSRKEITKASAEAKHLSADEISRWDSEGWTFYNWYEHRAYIWYPGASEAEERLMWDPRAQQIIR